MRWRRLTDEEARAIAEDLCDQHGWSYREPVRVARGLRTITVHPGADQLPGGPWIRLDARTGRIRSSGQPTR